MELITSDNAKSVNSRQVNNGYRLNLGFVNFDDWLNLLYSIIFLSPT
jgi:hypothetical protein